MEMSKALLQQTARQAVSLAGQQSMSWQMKILLSLQDRGCGKLMPAVHVLLQQCMRCPMYSSQHRLEPLSGPEVSRKSKLWVIPSSLLVSITIVAVSGCHAVDCKYRSSCQWWPWALRVSLQMSSLPSALRRALLQLITAVLHLMQHVFRACTADFADTILVQ